MELTIRVMLQNVYDSITRCALIRLASALQIPYFIFLSLEERLLQHLHLVVQRLSKDNSTITEKAKRVPVFFS